MQSVQVLVGDRLVPDSHALYQQLGFKPTGKTDTSTLNGDVIEPGERVDWMVFENGADFDTFMADLLHFHAAVRVCYASTLGDSWALVEKPSDSVYPRPIAISKCPSLPESKPYHD